MIIIQNKLISSTLFEEYFTCNLNACKGACCWEGDYGAPIEEEEKEVLVDIFQAIRPFLRPEGVESIQDQGAYIYHEEAKEFVTPLVDGKACAYMTYDDRGVAQCGIEKAFQAGKTDFRKPISCHLYPVRVSKDEELNFEALNYDEWDICSAACTLGQSLKMPLYRFVRDGLVRKYGEPFYEELEASVQYFQQEAGED